MIKENTLEIVQNIFSVLKENKDFFSFSVKEKEICLQKSKQYIPPSFHLYLCSISFEEMLNDIQEILKWYKEDTAIPNNKYMDAMIGYIVNQVGKILDILPLSFYMLSYEKRMFIFKEKENINNVLKNQLSTMSYQEITESIFSFLKKYDNKTPYIIIQSTRECSKETRQEIREHFLGQYKKSFPIFNVSSFLYGGIRIFVNGKVTDHSWLAKISDMTSFVS